MTGPNTFLDDFVRGIAAFAAPQVEDDGFNDRHSVQSSHDPLYYFEPAVVVRDVPTCLQAVREAVRS